MLSPKTDKEPTWPLPIGCTRKGRQSETRISLSTLNYRTHKFALLVVSGGQADGPHLGEGGRHRLLHRDDGHVLVLKMGRLYNTELENPQQVLSVHIFSSVSTFAFRKSVQKTCLDFLVSNANLQSKARHTVLICVLKKMEICTHLGKYRQTKIVGGFRLSIPRVPNQIGI